MDQFPELRQLQFVDKVVDGCAASIRDCSVGVRVEWWTMPVRKVRIVVHGVIPFGEGN